MAQMLVKKVEITDIPSFSDYLKEGMQISLIGAIDFSYSNGAAENPNSLHNITSGQSNQYEQALEAVGNILSNYDSD